MHVATVLKGLIILVLAPHTREMWNAQCFPQANATLVILHWLQHSCTRFVWHYDPGCVWWGSGGQQWHAEHREIYFSVHRAAFKRTWNTQFKIYWTSQGQHSTYKELCNWWDATCSSNEWPLHQHRRHTPGKYAIFIVLHAAVFDLVRRRILAFQSNILQHSVWFSRRHLFRNSY